MALGMVGAIVAALVLAVPGALLAGEVPSSLNEIGGIETLAARARDEGEVMVYGGPGYSKMMEWFKGFEAAYGIKVQYYRASSTTVFQRFMTEQAVGQQIADVLINSLRDNMMIADEAGYLAEYYPASASLFPEALSIPGKSWPTYLAIQAVAWNTDLVPPDLQQALREHPRKALLDPRLRGRLAMVNVTSGQLTLLGNLNVVANHAETHGWPYLKALADQEPMIVETLPALLDALTSGEAWVTPDAAESILAPAVLEGAPLAYAFPPVTAGTEFQMAVAERAPNPHAARLLMEWMTSPEAQQRLAEISQAPVVIDGWKDTREISRMDWYQPPRGLWFGLGDAPELHSKARKEFYETWQSIFGH